MNYLNTTENFAVIHCEWAAGNSVLHVHIPLPHLALTMQLYCILYEFELV